MSKTIEDPYLTMVSIGLPVFNSEDTIADAIQTIIDQTYKDWLLIISDNNSSDGTVRIIKEFVQLDNRIKFYQQDKNTGLGMNRYFVLSKANTKYFCWHAGDDLRSEDFLQENIDFLEENSNYIASTSRKIFTSLEAIQRPLNNSYALDESLAKDRFKSFFKNPWQSHSIYYSIMRTEDIKKCDDLKEDFLAQDWIINLFIARQGMIALQKNSYIILGSQGVSKKNPFKQFRNYAIEFVFPLYTFHLKFNKLITNFNIVDKMYFKLKVLHLHYKFFLVHFRKSIKLLLIK